MKDSEEQMPLNRKISVVVLGHDRPTDACRNGSDIAIVEGSTPVLMLHRGADLHIISLVNI